MVHIEDLQSNANNFVVTELSHDPVIRNIFNMIEKNIANAVTVTTSTNNIKELCSEPMKKSQKSNSENVAVYINGMETYDNLSNSTIPFCVLNKEQLIKERNNSEFDLKCSQKSSDDDKDQSISNTLTPNLEEKNQKSKENSLMLPKRQPKLTSISLSDSFETVSPVLLFAQTSVSFQYPDLKRQEAAYDAFVSRNIGKVITGSLYENRENMNSRTTDVNSFEAKLIDFKDQLEIREALKQLDDALDDQISTESFQTLSSKNSNTTSSEGNTESTKSNNNQKSVKQLVEILDSKHLQFRRRNKLSKLHPNITNQNSNFASDNESNTEMKTSLYVSDPETSKPSLIGVNIFGLNDGKSVAEIIAEKINHKNHSLHKHPPTSPKPVLKKPIPIPKSNTSDEEEQQKLLLASSPSAQAVHPSGKSISDAGRENMIFTIDKKPKIQTKHRRISKSEMLPTIIKVDDSESSASFKSVITDMASAVASTATDPNGKESSQQCLSETSVNHVYENLNQNDDEKYLETSFNGPIAMTTISGSKKVKQKIWYMIVIMITQHRGKSKNDSLFSQKIKY